jgi:hypothetical protein
VSGGWIIVWVAIALFLAVAWGFYSRGGGGINHRPLSPERGAAQSGGAGPSRISSAEDPTEGVPDQRGTG